MTVADLHNNSYDLTNASAVRERILVVDDDHVLRQVICESLGYREYDLSEAANVAEAKKLLQDETFSLVVSDIVMPGENGVALLRWACEESLNVPFIMMTGHAEISAVAEALNLGAYYFLQKPFRPLAMIEAVKNVLRSSRLEKQNEQLRHELASYNARLRQEVIEAQIQNQRLVLATLTALTNAIDARDAYTCAHSTEVSRLAGCLARQLNLDLDLQDAAETAGQLHDIGKIAVPENVLLKPSRLDEQEFRQIKEHPVHGERILKPLPEFELVLPGVRHHHERYDGKGYPDGLRGEQIPLVARIISVCDTWSAMRTNRPYRPMMAYEAALAVIEGEKGRQFDPEIAHAFVDLSQKIDLSELVQP